MAFNRKSILMFAAPAVLLAMGAWHFMAPHRSHPEKLETVTVAWSPFESSMLLHVACENGLFERHGIRVVPRKYDTGASSLESLIQGEADITVGATEFPTVRQAFRRAPIRVIADIDQSEFIYLIARKDRGIATVADLAGKRVGTTVGTVAEFHLGRFLEINGLQLRDIQIVNVTTPQDWVGAVVRGDLDAISTAQPYAHALQVALGDNAIVWPAQGGQPLHGLVVTSNKWLAARADQAKAFLLALAEAEDWLIRHPVGAQAILQRRLGLDDAYVPTAWSQNQFALSLDQTLIVTMEDEARWMIKNRLTPEARVPNFLDYIRTDALKAVRPEAVTIVGR